MRAEERLGASDLQTILLAGRTLKKDIFPFFTLRSLIIILYTANQSNILYAFLLYLLLPKCHPYSRLLHPFLLFKFTSCPLMKECPPPFRIYRILASLRVEIPCSFPQYKTSCPQRHVTGPVSCCTLSDLHERVK